MDLYDQSYQACLVLIPHFCHEKGMGCTHNTFCQIYFVFADWCGNFVEFECNDVDVKGDTFLIMFAQLRDVFVYDFISLVKICEGEMYYMFCDK